jgi:adenylate kinase
LITGTPGCGKTTLCKLLNESLNFKYLNISEMIITHKLYDSWNEEFNVPEFDDDKLLEYIEEKYKI